MTIALATIRSLLRLVRVIVMFATVPSQFTGDRALVAADNRGDLRLVMGPFNQSKYLISLFAGKLSVAH